VQRALAQLQLPTVRLRRWGAACRAVEPHVPPARPIARGAVQPILGQAPSRVAVFRQATWGGCVREPRCRRRLPHWLDLRSGRLPRRCTPSDWRARADRVRARGAELPLSARRRPRRHSSRAPPSRRTSAAARETAADPACERRAAVPARAAARRRPDRAHLRLDRARRAAFDPRLGAREPRRAPRPRAGEPRQRSDIFTIAAPTGTISSIRATSRVAGGSAC